MAPNVVEKLNQIKHRRFEWEARLKGVYREEVKQDLREMLAQAEGKSYQQFEFAAKAVDAKRRQDFMVKANASADTALTIMKEPPPANRNVVTLITSKVPNSNIHYMTKADHDNGLTDSWQSYTYNTRMHIGQYRFEVLPPDNREAWQEDVLILDDPTKKELAPRSQREPQ